MPYWNFEYTKAVIYTVVKVGGGIGQDPATEVTHLRLNQPPVFSSAYFLGNFITERYFSWQILSPPGNLIAHRKSSASTYLSASVLSIT